MGLWVCGFAGLLFFVRSFCVCAICFCVPVCSCVIVCDCVFMNARVCLCVDVLVLASCVSCWLHVLVVCGIACLGVCVKIYF